MTAPKPGSFRSRQAGASLSSLCFYWFCATVTRAVLRLCFGARALGLERVPREGPLLLVANHQSYLDPPAIGSLMKSVRHLDFIARVGLFTFKPFGWLIRSLNSIPIHGGAGDAASIKEVLRRLEMGRAVLIFPEGGRSQDGKLGEFKRGAAVLVKRSGCPVLPVAIDGAWDAWPPARRFPKPFGARVTVLYGTPIPHDELLANGVDAAMHRLHDEVAALHAQITHARQHNIPPRTAT